MTLFRRMAVLCTPLMLCGCGNPGSPLPPSLLLPQPVTDLSAARTGSEVSLHWTMTRRATDRVMLKGDQRAVICRAAGTEPCTTIGALMLEEGKPADYTDTLPDTLAEGSMRLLRYEVSLQNHARQSGGVSNLAYAAAGSAPPRIESAEATPTADGVLVQWKAAQDSGKTAAEKSSPKPRLLVRLTRDRVLQPGETVVPDKQATTAGVPQPLQQTLEATERAPAQGGGASWAPDHTIDAQAALNRSYRYTVQLVEQTALDGHPMEVAGLTGRSNVVAAKDTFPPAVPSELAAVADKDSGSIDLSWSASPDLDTVGYFVYRKAAASSNLLQKISGATPVATPAWSDKTAKKGEHYLYSVSAADASGNESSRSTETAATLP